jgi:hypothetical protein
MSVKCAYCHARASRNVNGKDVCYSHIGAALEVEAIPANAADLEAAPTLDTMRRLMIQQEAAAWFGSGRAIHAWRLRRIFRQAGWPVPEEIESYLDACNERLCEADLTSPEEVANAFDLGPTGRKARVSIAQLEVILHVFALKAMNPDWKMQRLWREVATHLNAQGDPDKDKYGYVKKTYYEWRDNFHKTRQFCGTTQAHSGGYSRAHRRNGGPRR